MPALRKTKTYGPYNVHYDSSCNTCPSKKEKACPKGYGSLVDYKKKDDCEKCDEKCCANPCLDVQKNVVAISKCTKKFEFEKEILEGMRGSSTETELELEVEFDVITAIYEIILTNKSCDTIKNVQIQDSLAGVGALAGVHGGTDPFGKDVTLKAKAQSCNDHLKVLDSREIRKSGGNLLDSCKSCIPPCTSCRLLVKFTFSIFNFEFEFEKTIEERMMKHMGRSIESFEFELERSCTLSKVTNSLTVTGQIEEECATGYDNGHAHGCDCCKKVKCTDICPIVVQAETILDDDMELACHPKRRDDNGDQVQI